MAPLVRVLSLARPAVPLTLAICYCISAQHKPMGVNFGPVCSVSGHTGGLEDAVLP